jgi:phosphatidylglycerophosphate synthase
LDEEMMRSVVEKRATSRRASAPSTPSAPSALEKRRAVLFCEPATAGLRVAGLTLLDRLIVSARRSGCDEIHVVCQGRLPETRRARALKIPFEVSPTAPRGEGLTLVATTSLCAHAQDLALLWERVGARLADADGKPAPAGVFRNWSGGAAPDFAGLSIVKAKGPSIPVSGEDDARRAARKLWDSLVSGSDGWVDRVFNRPLGRPLSKILTRTEVTPNAVSVASILIGLVGAVMLGVGEWAWAVAGALVFQLSAVVDCVDGDLARATFRESALGRWLDIVGDQIVHSAVFAGIAAGLARSGSHAPAAWLGAAGVLGVAFAFAVVMWGARRTNPGSTAQKVLDGTTNRDFSVVVIALALAGRLEWFLWAAAIGSHVFWIMALMIQSFGAPGRGRSPA